MYNDLPPNIPHEIPEYISLTLRDDVKLWNNTAKDCYFLGCNCEECFIHKTYFYNKYDSCKMKFYVCLLLKKLGAPKEKTA